MQCTTPNCTNPVRTLKRFKVDSLKLCTDCFYQRKLRLNREYQQGLKDRNRIQEVPRPKKTAYNPMSLQNLSPAKMYIACDMIVNGWGKR